MLTVSTGGETVTIAGPVVGARTLFGANLAGWLNRGETVAAAQPRIVTAFGAVPVVRDWPTGSAWTWAQRLALYPWGPSLISEFTPTNLMAPTSGDLANFQRLCQTCPTGRPMWLVIGHEPDGKTRASFNNPTGYLAAMAQYGAIHRRYSPPNLRFSIVLMGSTFLPDRYTWGGNQYPASTWLPAADWYDDVGCDVYQQMTGAKAVDTGVPDTAARMLQPVFDLAAKLGKGTIFPEFGMFCVDTFHQLDAACVGQPDSVRAQILGDCIAMFRANHARAVCYFETTVGGTDNPCCLTPPPGFTAPYSPATLAVWRAAATS